jgi:hypothetical protein
MVRTLLGLLVLPDYVRVISNLTRRSVSVQKSVAEFEIIYNFETFGNTTKLLNSTM